MEWSIPELEDLASIFWILDQTAGLLQPASHAEDPAVKPGVEQLAGVGDGGEGTLTGRDITDEANFLSECLVVLTGHFVSFLI